MVARRVGLLLTIGALLVAGCGSSSKSGSSTSTTDATTAGIPEVVVTATEYSFKFPQPTLPSGLVKITLKNDGTAPEGHQMNLIKLGSLTLNQIRLVLRLALAHGQELDRDRAIELAGVVGAGFGFRAIARQLLDFVPFAGWAVKGAIAYTGTRAIGTAAEKYFDIRS